jgi:hypothetical protein
MADHPLQTALLVPLGEGWAFKPWEVLLEKEVRFLS